MPHRSSLPLNWRRKDERYRMKASKCSTCSETFFPPRMICPNCRRKGKIIETFAPTTGKLYSYSIMYSAPEGFENTVPYVIGIIELDDKTRILSQLTGIELDEIKIGIPLRTVFRKVSTDGESGLIHYAFKFTKLE